MADFSSSIINLFYKFWARYFFDIFFFIKSLSSIKKVDLKISFLVFLIWPYSYDLFIHPSLQEKYVFLVFPLLIYFLYKTKNKTFVFIVSLFSPFKITGFHFYIYYYF